MGTFTLGNVQAARDVNFESTVSNTGDTTITVNYAEIAKSLASLATNEEEAQKMRELSKAIEEKDESLVSKIIDGIADNVGLIGGICKIAFKVLF